MAPRQPEGANYKWQPSQTDPLNEVFRKELPSQTDSLNLKRFPSETDATGQLKFNPAPTDSLGGQIADDLNPQPLPPGQAAADDLNPQPLPPGRAVADDLNPQPLPPGRAYSGRPGGGGMGPVLLGLGILLLLGVVAAGLLVGPSLLASAGTQQRHAPTTQSQPTATATAAPQPTATATTAPQPTPTNTAVPLPPPPTAQILSPTNDQTYRIPQGGSVQITLSSSASTGVTRYAWSDSLHLFTNNEPNDTIAIQQGQVGCTNGVSDTISLTVTDSHGQSGQAAPVTVIYYPQCIA